MSSDALAATDSLERPQASLPLVVVTGASGSGKSTLLPMLMNRLRGTHAVFDVDWLIDPLSTIPGRSDSVDWATFRDTWLHVAYGVARNHLTPVLMGPFIPEHLDDLPGRALFSEVHWLLLDCPDEERRKRIDARPESRARDVEAQVEFAAWLRSNMKPIIDTSKVTPDAAADAAAQRIVGVHAP